MEWQKSLRISQRILFDFKEVIRDFVSPFHPPRCRLTHLQSIVRFYFCFVSSLKIRKYKKNSKRKKELLPGVAVEELVT